MNRRLQNLKFNSLRTPELRSLGFVEPILTINSFGLSQSHFSS